MSNWRFIIILYCSSLFQLSSFNTCSFLTFFLFRISLNLYLAFNTTTTSKVSAALSGASVASSRYPRTMTHYGLVWDLHYFLPGGEVKWSDLYTGNDQYMSTKV